MAKKCTALWREARLQVKMYKAHQHRSTLGSWDVEKMQAVVARSTFRSQKCKKRRVRTTFGRSDVVKRGCFVAVSSKTTSTLHYTTLQYTTLHSTTLTTGTATTTTTTTLLYTTLRYFTLHYTTLHYIAGCYTTTITASTALRKLRYTTTTTPLRYSYNYSSSTPRDIQPLWVRRPLQPLQPVQKA